MCSCHWLLSALAILGLCCHASATNLNRITLNLYWDGDKGHERLSVWLLKQLPRTHVKRAHGWKVHPQHTHSRNPFIWQWHIFRSLPLKGINTKSKARNKKVHYSSVKKKPSDTVSYWGDTEAMQSHHLPNPCSSKSWGEKRGQPCGQKLIFLLVAHCCRRANMPQENSTTHTPLFSSGFSQLYTQQQSRNREWTRIPVSPEGGCARAVWPEADSRIWQPTSRRSLGLGLRRDESVISKRGAHLLSFQFCFDHFPCLLLSLLSSPLPNSSSAPPPTHLPNCLRAHLLHSAPVLVLPRSHSLSHSAVRIKHLSRWSSFRP